MRLKLAMTAITGFGLVLSLCAQLLAAYLFGASGEMDAYFAGVALPMFLVLLANEVATLYVVPLLHRASGPDLRRLQARYVASSFAFFTALSLLGILLRGPIVAALFPGVDQESAARVLAIQFCAVPFSTGALLLLHFRFLAGAYAVSYFVFLLTPLFMIASGLALHRQLGTLSFAVGSALGAAAQFALLFALAKAWRLPFREAARGGARLQWRVPLLLACAVLPVHATALFDRHFAASLGEGALSAIAYSWFFALAAVSLVFRGWSMPVFHALSGEAAGEAAAFRQRLVQSCVELAAVGAAALAVLQLAGPALIVLLLQRGAFAVESAELVQSLFRYHSVSVLGIVLFLLFVRACCAMRAYRPVAAFGAAACVAYAALASLLLPQGAIGIACANAVTWSVVGLAGIAYLLRAVAPLAEARAA
jgi:putative peptidoglycan lipid II flippase